MPKSVARWPFHLVLDQYFVLDSRSRGLMTVLKNRSPAALDMAYIRDFTSLPFHSSCFRFHVYRLERIGLGKPSDPDCTSTKNLRSA